LAGRRGRERRTRTTLLRSHGNHHNDANGAEGEGCGERGDAYGEGAKALILDERVPIDAEIVDEVLSSMVRGPKCSQTGSTRVVCTPRATEQDAIARRGFPITYDFRAALTARCRLRSRNGLFPRMGWVGRAGEPARARHAPLPVSDGGYAETAMARSTGAQPGTALRVGDPGCSSLLSSQLPTAWLAQSSSSSRARRRDRP
jgi:hypothetical protein